MASYGISDWRKLGAVLRDARRGQQLSQEELAERAGVSRAWLAKLESGGHRRAEVEQVFRLLSALSLELVVRDKQRGTEESTYMTALERALRTDAAAGTSTTIRVETSRRAQIAAERRAALARDSEAERAGELTDGQAVAPASAASGSARRPGPDSR